MRHRHSDMHDLKDINIHTQREPAEDVDVLVRL